jgi:YadA head domain repeat (2 copies)
MKRLAVGFVFLFGLSFGAVSPGADFNGDGQDDVAIFRESSGLWAVRGVTRVYFGGSMDIPLPGDYDGNNTAEVAIFRPSSGLWAVRGVSRIYYGADGDLPLGESGLKQSSNFFYDPVKYAFRAGQATGGEWNDQSVGEWSVAMGYNTTASGNFSTAMGIDTIARGAFSTAMGNSTTARGLNSIAMGKNTTASGDRSTAMGEASNAAGLISTAMGFSTIASGDTSTAMGYWTSATGNNSTAMGNYIKVTGAYSFGYGTNNSSSRIVSADNVFVIDGANVGIGTLSPNYKLDVAGDINTTGDIRKSGSAYAFPDYVFEPDYRFLSMPEMKKYIFANKHLPGMPSAEEVQKDGVRIFEHSRVMLEKLEEAYLYIIQQNEDIARLEKELKAENNALRKRIEAMEKKF